MSSFFDIFIGLIAAYSATSLEGFYKASNHTEWYLVYLAPLVTAGLIIWLLLLIKSFILYLKRPLKKYECFWIETIDNSRHTNDDLISIMKLSYKNNKYHIVGKTEYKDGRGCLATWKSENVFLYDEQNLELDYIYKADLISTSVTTRGYAKIQLKHKLGFIIDIDQGSTIIKQQFNLTPINKLKELRNFDDNMLCQNNKTSFISFYNEYK